MRARHALGGKSRVSLASQAVTMKVCATLRSCVHINIVLNLVSVDCDLRKINPDRFSILI